MTDGRLLAPAASPEECAVERIFYKMNARTLVPVAQASGVALLAAARAGAEVYEYAPLEVKLAVVGTGASELGVGFSVTSGPVLERAGDLAAILTNLQDRDVLFIDEIHRLARTVEEILYPAMEDFRLDIVIGKGPSARSIRVDIPRFTLVGATTRTGMLTSPLRDRFGFTGRLDFYEPPELAAIVRRSAAILDIGIEQEAGEEIAVRSRGTPRIANRLLRRVRDFAQVRAAGRISLQVARDALDLFQVDTEGLDKVDMAILRALAERFRGRPVGLTTLAVAVGEEPDTIEDVYEPFLLRKGFIQRTPRGRLATLSAYEHLGLREAFQRLV